MSINAKALMKVLNKKANIEYESSDDETNEKSDNSPIETNETNETKKYNIISILCKRRVNSKNPGSTTQEVIIKNY